MSTLNGKAINETFDGLLKTADENALPVTGRVIIQDGLGNNTALSIGRAGEGIAIDGPIEGITGGGTVSDKTFAISSLSNFISNGSPIFVSFLIAGDTCESIYVKFLTDSSRLPVYTTTISNPTNNTTYGVAQSFTFNPGNYIIVFEAKFADNTVMYDISKFPVAYDKDYVVTESLQSFGPQTNPDFSNAKRIWDLYWDDKLSALPQMPRPKWIPRSFYEIYTHLSSTDDTITTYFDKDGIVPQLGYVSQPNNPSALIEYSAYRSGYWYNQFPIPTPSGWEDTLFYTDPNSGVHQKVEVIYSRNWSYFNRDDRSWIYKIDTYKPTFYEGFMGDVEINVYGESVSTDERTIDLTAANKDIPDRCGVLGVKPSYVEVGANRSVRFLVVYEAQNQISGQNDVSIYDVASMQIISTGSGSSGSSIGYINASTQNVDVSTLSEGQQLEGWATVELANTPSFIYTKSIILDRPTVTLTQNGSPTANSVGATLTLTKWAYLNSNDGLDTNLLFKVIRTSDGSEVTPSTRIDGLSGVLNYYVKNYFEQYLWQDSITLQNINIDLSWIPSYTGAITVQVIGRDYWDVMTGAAERVLASFNYTV